VGDHEDALGLERVLSLFNGHGEVLSVVGHFGPHVVHEEWLGEVVFVVRVGHRLEVESHHGSALDVAELVAASRGVAVRVEELGHGSAVLWEVWVVQARVPLLVVVNNVVGLRGEELAKLFVGEHCVQNHNFVHGWLSSLVPDASSGDHGEGKEVDFPEEGVVEHQERSRSPGTEASGPGVVGSVDAETNLVEVVRSTHSVLPVVVVEDVARVSELRRVALCLWSDWSILFLDGTHVVHVDTVVALRGSESSVVEVWVGRLAVVTAWQVEQRGCLLLKGKVSENENRDRRGLPRQIDAASY